MGRMKLLWVSVNPNMQSSFSLVSHELLKRLQGYEKCYLAQFFYGKPRFGKYYTTVPFHASDHLLYYLSNLKPDIVLFYQSPAFLTNIPAWIIKKIKEVAELVVYAPVEGYPLTYDVPMFSEADLILVPSNFSQRCLRQEGYKSDVLEHGVDPSVFKPTKDWRMKFDNPNPFKFGCIASDNWRKQLTRIVDAYNILLQKAPTSRLTMLATTYDIAAWMPNLKKYVEKLKIPVGISETTRLNLAVSTRTMVKLYALWHCHILPTSESFGLPSLEAMACGTVPIVIEHGASKEVVTDCGIYADVSDYLATAIGKIALVDIEDLADKMYWAVNNPDELRKLAEKGIKRAKLFTWESSAQKLQRLLCG